MDLRDATLTIRGESAAYPGLAELAQSAFDQLTRDGWVDYRVLSDMIEEASGTGVLRAISHKYGPTARDAIFGPILREIDRQKPVRPRSATPAHEEGPDPLAPT